MPSVAVRAPREVPESFLQKELLSWACSCEESTRLHLPVPQAATWLPGRDLHGYASPWLPSFQPEDWHVVGRAASCHMTPEVRPGMCVCVTGCWVAAHTRTLGSWWEQLTAGCPRFSLSHHMDFYLLMRDELLVCPHL